METNEFLPEKKINYGNTKQLTEDCWLFLTDDSMPDTAIEIRKEAFLHEVGAMLETVKQHFLKVKFDKNFDVRLKAYIERKLEESGVEQNMILSQKSKIIENFLDSLDDAKETLSKSLTSFQDHEGFKTAQEFINEIDPDLPEGKKNQFVNAFLAFASQHIPDGPKELMIRLDERKRAEHIAYLFYEDHTSSYESKKRAEKQFNIKNGVAFVERERADVARLIGNAISGHNALSVVLNIPDSTLIQKEYHIKEPLLAATMELLSKPLRNPCKYCGQQHLDYACNKQIQFIKESRL